MKKNIFNLLIIVATGIAIVGCKNKAEEVTTTNTETAMLAEYDDVTYTVNVDESTIEWQGFKPTGSHKGTINIETGTFTTNDGKIQSGSFVIDMSSIKESEDNARLEGHLKSADFFDIEKFPTAGFKISGLVSKDGNTMLSGNLTIKDTTNNVTFPVTVVLEDDTLTLSSEVFTIDRSKWNVRYGSKSFFDNLKDKFINDDIELKIVIKAKKS
ncbi:YceI family protein [Flavobacteriaceae bacterium PRS1]|nr:YceI family protein [Flavobacteriaceae bacterium PRS1]